MRGIVNINFASFNQFCTKVKIKMKLKQNFLLKIPLLLVGILAPGSAHAGPSAQPPIGTTDMEKDNKFPHAEI